MRDLILSSPKTALTRSFLGNYLKLFGFHDFLHMHLRFYELVLKKIRTLSYSKFHEVEKYILEINNKIWIGYLYVV